MLSIEGGVGGVDGVLVCISFDLESGELAAIKGKRRPTRHVKLRNRGSLI